MKVTSAILTTMSGKIGGAVASRSRGDIQYFRKLVIPSNPGTAMQKAARDGIASASSYWRTALSEANQEAWWDLATGSQTGQTLFNKVNQPRIFANNAGRTATDDSADIVLPIQVTPPDTFSTGFTTPTSIVIDDSANTLVINGWNAADQVWDGCAGGTPASVFIYVSHEQNSSRFSRQHPYVLARCQTYKGAPSAAVTVNLATLGITTMAGKVMYVKMVAQNFEGSSSVPSESRITIVT